MEVEISEVANMPSSFGTFKLQAFKQKIDGNIKEHLVIFSENFGDIPLIRVHSECLTGDALGSRKCDCGEQLRYALKKIYKEGGMVIYLRQEGRDIGLLNKINAYSLQDKGFDTVEANHQLGLHEDARTYEMVDFVLNYYGVKKIRLLTNNPKKIESIKGVEIVKREPIIIKPHEDNAGYLNTKKEKMGHLF